MTWIDYAIIAIAVASAAFGYWRGFVKEALSLVTWLLAILLAWQGAWLIEDRLGDWSSAPELRIWVARAILFVAVLIIGGVLTWALRGMIRGSGLSGTDRALGAIFGLARGVLFVGLLAILIEALEVDSREWWEQARLRPFSEQVADGILYYADLGKGYLEGV